MNAFEVLGWIAPFVFAVVFIPQVIKVFLSKKTEGLSAISYMVVFLGSTLYMFWGGVKEEHMLQLFVAEAIVSASELIIIYYIFKNLKKMWIFYIAAVWEFGLFILTIVFLSIDSLSLSPEWVLPITIIGGVSIAFAFMPQTIRALITRDVKNISILTVVALFIATSLLGTYQIGQGKATDGWALTTERYIGVVIEYMAAAWSIPQFILKILDNRKIRNAQMNNSFEREAVKEWMAKEHRSIYQRAAIIEWMSSEEHIDKENLDQIANRLKLKHKDIDKIIVQHKKINKA